MLEPNLQIAMEQGLNTPVETCFSFLVNDEEQKKIGDLSLGHIARELDKDNKFTGYKPATKRRLEHQTGLRLRHLMPLNKQIYFSNDLGLKKYVEVDEGLMESLLIRGFGHELDTVHF